MTYVTVRHGKMARFFGTGAPYWPTRPVAPGDCEVVMRDKHQDDEDIEEAETKSTISSVSKTRELSGNDVYAHRRAVQLYVDEKRAMEIAMEKLFGVILSMMTARSVELLKRQKDYADIEERMDPYDLWRMVCRLHSQGSANIQGVDRIKVLRTYENIRMTKSESPHQFRALDPTRYGDLKDRLQQYHYGGIAYPTTLDAAMRHIEGVAVKVTEPVKTKA